MEWSHIDNVQYQRAGHSADLIVGSVYLFGGYYRGDKNDVQVYDIQNSTLQRVDAVGNPPSARGYHGSAVIEEHLYVFGGTGS
jgi:N-acetylneuraminic acid mutarotase